MPTSSSATACSPLSIRGTRRLGLPGGETVLCSDTVGFVRKLPHQLVTAFHSTLETVADSDLLVHVVDSSAADPEGQMAAVRAVLVEIEAQDVPELYCFNKADLAPKHAERLAEAFPPSVACSAKTGEGLDRLLAQIGDAVRASDRTVELSVPYERGDVIAALHRNGEVIDQHDAGGAIAVRARVDEATRRRYAEFAVVARSAQHEPDHRD